MLGGGALIHIASTRLCNWTLKGERDITLLSARSLHPWMKCPGSEDVATSPYLFGVVISLRFSTVAGAALYKQGSCRSRLAPL